MMRISDEEVWLRAYTAIIGEVQSLSMIGDKKYLTDKAFSIANKAVEDFNTRFPAFDFASNQGKEKYNTDGSLPSSPAQK
jgi:hypothetical protein